MNLLPDYYYQSLDLLSPESLKQKGIAGAIFDFDNTLLEYRANHLKPDIKRILARWSRVFGNKKLIIVSNNPGLFFGRTLQQESKRLGIKFLASGLLVKPLPFILKNAAKTIGVEPQAVIVVGDQLITDVFGGKLAGMTTALIQPLKSCENIIAKIARPLERYILRNHDYRHSI